MADSQPQCDFFLVPALGSTAGFTKYGSLQMPKLENYPNIDNQGVRSIFSRALLELPRPSAPGFPEIQRCSLPQLKSCLLTYHQGWQHRPPSAGAR